MNPQADRKKYFVMLIACVALIFGAGLLYGFLRMSEEKKKNPVPDKPVMSFQDEGAHLGKLGSDEVVESTPIPPVKVRDYAWNRNPFIPAEKPLSGAVTPKKENRQPVSTVSFELQGVLKSEGGFLAIINGETCQEGSMLQGWRIEKIGDYRVWLRRGARKKILELSENPGGIGVR